MRILFALAGLHRVDRGAEVAFIAVASELARSGHGVTLIGAGPERPGSPYRFIHAPALRREQFEGWRRLPPLRSETVWEEATFFPGLLGSYRPGDYDVTVTCAYPFTNWALRRPPLRGRRPAHVFVTQNGDWPAYGNNAEFRLFNCEGLVCTNPHFFERNRERYRCALIPNGVDLDRFAPGPAARSRFGLPQGPIVLMVSALIGNKKVAEGIAAVSSVPDATLVVAGDGPLREEIHQLADKLLPGRFLRLTVPSKDMPDLYRSADAFMHLSTDESFGNVFVEAMASGLPIVAYDAPRTRWIIGDDACYPETQHTGDLSAAIVRALQIPVAVESPKRAEEFSWPVIAARYEAFFRELLQ